MTDLTDTACMKVEPIDGAWEATIYGDCNVYTGKTKSEAIRKAKNRPVVPKMCAVCGNFLDPESDSYQSQDPPEMCTDCYQENFEDFVLNNKNGPFSSNKNTGSSTLKRV